MTITITIINNADPLAKGGPELILRTDGQGQSGDMVLPPGSTYAASVDAQTTLTLSQRGEDLVNVPASRIAALEAQVAALQAALQGGNGTLESVRLLGDDPLLDAHTHDDGNS